MYPYVPILVLLITVAINIWAFMTAGSVMWKSHPKIAEEIGIPKAFSGGKISVNQWGWMIMFGDKRLPASKEFTLRKSIYGATGVIAIGIVVYIYMMSR